MTLEELRDSPAIKEHWPHVSRLIDGFLDEFGIETAMGASCEESRAQAEASANKLIAQLRKHFRSLAIPKERVQPTQTTKPLHRFETKAKPATTETK